MPGAPELDQTTGGSLDGESALGRGGLLPKAIAHQHFTEPQIVEAVFTITIYIAVSKFGDTLGVALEPVFSGIRPILEVAE